MRVDAVPLEHLGIVQILCTYVIWMTNSNSPEYNLPRVQVFFVGNHT